MLSSRRSVRLWVSHASTTWYTCPLGPIIGSRNARTQNGWVLWYGRGIHCRLKISSPSVGVQTMVVSDRPSVQSASSAM